MMDPYFDEMPLIPILRGLAPDRAVEVGEILYATGFRIMEIPLNSPDPFDSIARLVDHFGDGALIGAGTVTTVAHCRMLSDIGARLVVAPNTDPAVIPAARDAGMVVIPGVATPSEAFAALHAGADALKLFPAEAVGPSGLRAWRAVLPPATRLIAVGGVDTSNMARWRAAGSDGFGIGSALFRPDMSTDDIRRHAHAFTTAFHSIKDQS